MMQLQGFCDSDWVSCLIMYHSMIGYLTMLSSSPVSWEIKKQSTDLRSSVEVEYNPMAAAMSELIWLKSLLASLCGMQ